MKAPATWVTYDTYQECPVHGLEREGSRRFLVLERPDGVMTLTREVVDPIPLHNYPGAFS